MQHPRTRGVRRREAMGQTRERSGRRTCRQDDATRRPNGARLVEQAVCDGVHRGLSPVANLQLLEDVFEVRLYRCDGH